MYGYIYKITNLINGKIYIGQHKYSKPELDTNYIASGILINESIKKYGLKNFNKELIDTANNLEELNQKEIYYINLFNSKAPNGYNLTNGGDGMLNPSDETRNKMALKKLGTKQSEETKEKRIIRLKQIEHTQEWALNISKARQGQKMPDLCIQKSKERLYGTSWYNNGIEENRWLEDDVPEGWVKGRLNGYHPTNLGYKHSEETKQKAHNIMVKKIWFNNGKEEIRIEIDSDIPKGYVKGRLKRKIQ